MTLSLVRSAMMDVRVGAVLTAPAGWGSAEDLVDPLLQTPVDTGHDRDHH